MIADLLRNDLSKVCTANSIKVKKLCGLESYPTVFHLVTVIEGILQNNVDSFGSLRSMLPWRPPLLAPQKFVSMQVIYELEAHCTRTPIAVALVILALMAQWIPLLLLERY